MWYFYTLFFSWFIHSFVRSFNDAGGISEWGKENTGEQWLNSRVWSLESRVWRTCLKLNRRGSWYHRHHSSHLQHPTPDSDSGSDSNSNSPSHFNACICLHEKYVRYRYVFLPFARLAVTVRWHWDEDAGCRMLFLFFLQVSSSPSFILYLHPASNIQHPVLSRDFSLQCTMYVH